ncbi:MAG: pitrilysin family protein [archaeon]
MPFTKRKLKNGITVLHEPRPLPLVALSISNPFGASFETEKEKGIAHFIEHLVFTGTKTRSHEDISKEIEKKGGILNAFTSHDITSFLFKLPSEHLFAGLDILTDILNNPLFEKEKFEKEKKVILEEIKMYHDMPMRHVHDLLENTLYKSPFGLGIAGSKESVSSLTRDFVFNYFKKHYNPKNYIVTVVGNADLKKICDYLEKNFSPKKSLTTPQKIKLHNKHSTEERPGIDQAHFMFAFHAPFQTDKKHSVLEVLNAYLAKGMSSRLFLEIREKRGLAYSIQGSINTEKNYSYYSIYVGTTKEAISKVKELILKEFNNIDSMTPSNLSEAKESLVGYRKVSSEESTNVMNELLFAEISTKAEDYYEEEDKINSVTLKEVKDFASTATKSYSTAAIVPK